MPFSSKSNKASSPLVKIQDVPDVPTIGTAVAGPEEALVAFTPAATGGKAALYRALSTPGSIEATGSASPILVPGLTAGTSYTFQVRGESNTGASTGYSSASNAVVPTVAGAYELIESNILTSSASSVTFSSIPQDYKHLQIRGTSRAAAVVYNRSMEIFFNGDTNYLNQRFHMLRGDGTSVVSGAYSGDNYIMEMPGDAAVSGNYAGFVCDVLDYSNANKNTTTRTLSGFYETGGPNYRIFLRSGLWIDTSSVSSITLQPNAGDIAAGSRFSLYGIRG